MPETPTIEALHAAWVDAFNRHDLEAHGALYTADAMMFGSTPDLVLGREGVRAYFAKRPPGMQVRNYPLPRISQLTPESAATAAYVDFADGDKVFPFRITWMLVKRNGNWLIAQHHGSPRS
jgi:uncharacterized protein (TIGR02246 family)